MRRPCGQRTGSWAASWIPSQCFALPLPLDRTNTPTPVYEPKCQQRLKRLSIAEMGKSETFARVSIDVYVYMYEYDFL